MQGSNARTKIIVGLCLGLGGFTGCQSIREKIPAPKLAMPKVKMPNLMAWRDNDESAVLTSAEQPDSDPPTPSSNATPFTANGTPAGRATASNSAASQGVSPVSYPATPYASVPATGRPPAMGSRASRPNVPKAPNYQIGPYGVTTPPRASTPPSGNTAGVTRTPTPTAPAMQNRNAPPSSSSHLAAPGSNTPTAGSARAGATPQDKPTSQWDNIPTTPHVAPLTTEQPSQDTRPASRWDQLDPGFSTQTSPSANPPSAAHPSPSGLTDAASPPSPPVASSPASPEAQAPASNGVGSASPPPTVAVASWDQPATPPQATPSTDSGSPAAAITQVSHSDPESDTTQRPNMNSYSDHAAAQGSMPWRPGSTDSYVQSTAASIAGAIRSATTKAADTPTNSSAGGAPLSPSQQ